MEGGGVDTLPSLRIPGHPGVNRSTIGQLSRGGSVSLPMTPDLIQTPSNNTQFPHGDYKRVANRRTGYTTRTAAYGSPDVVKKIFTGQLPSTYFNDICYGRRATPREFEYKTPCKDRVKELWEPKNVSREETRHVIRDIQDARFRKQKQMEKQTIKKMRVSRLKTEHALLKEAETMSRGLTAYLVKLDKQKQKYLKSNPKKQTRTQQQTLYQNQDFYPEY